MTVLEFKKSGNKIRNLDFLSHIIEEGVCEEKVIDAVVKSLVDFHRKALDNSDCNYALDSDVAWYSLYVWYVERIRFVLNSLNLPEDNFSRVCLEGVCRYLNWFLINNRKLIISRARKGFITAIHGNVIAGNFFTSSDFNIFELNPQKWERSSAYWEDVLSDLASLCISLEIAGFSAVSKQVSKIYRHKLKGAFNRQLFRFFMVARSADEALKKLAEGTKNIKELGLSMIWSLGLERGFICGILEAKDSTFQELFSQAEETLGSCIKDSEKLFSFEGKNYIIPLFRDLKINEHDLINSLNHLSRTKKIPLIFLRFISNKSRNEFIWETIEDIYRINFEQLSRVVTLCEAEFKTSAENLIAAMTLMTSPGWLNVYESESLKRNWERSEEDFGEEKILINIAS